MKGYNNLICKALFCLFLLSILTTKAQTTYVPDDVFEYYLETHDSIGNVVAIGAPTSMGDGEDGNDLVLTSRISGVTILDIPNLEIASFQGLEDFTALTDFTNIDNSASSIEEINFSQNSNLINISIVEAPNLVGIDISGNLLLERLWIDTIGNALTSLNISNNLNLNQLLASGNASLQYINLKNNANTLINELDVRNNSSNLCILVDDKSYSETATDWFKDTTASYFDSLISTEAQDDSVFYDGSGNQADVDAWLANNGGAISDCGDVTWTITDINLIDNPNQYNYTLIYEVSWNVEDIFGYSEYEFAIFTIENVKHFSSEFYGTGDNGEVCENNFDLNRVIVEFNGDTAATLNDAKINSISFEQTEGLSIPTAVLNDGDTVIDFPESGAGSYAYRFDTTINKTMDIYDPTDPTNNTTSITDETTITIFEKLVAYDAGEDITLYKNPLENLSVEELTNSLNIFPNLPPQNSTFDKNQYWSGENNLGEVLTITDNNGPGFYTWDATGVFSECFSSNEEEIEAVIATLTLVGGYELGLVYVSSYDFKVVAIPSFDSSNDTEISEIGFTLVLPAGNSTISNVSGLLDTRSWNTTKTDAQTLSGLGLGDGTKDAHTFNLQTGQSFLSHTQGEQIDLVSFTLDNPPSSGLISLLSNTDPITMDIGGEDYKSYYNSNINNTSAQNYYFRTEPNFESFNLSSLSTSSLELINDLNIYPNPTEGILYIRDNKKQIFKIQVYSITGNLIIEYNAQSGVIDVSKLRSGIYFIKTYTNYSSEVFKIIKE